MFFRSPANAGSDTGAAVDDLQDVGQRSLIRFSQLQTQASLPASTFEFKVPAGADVLKQ